jgi:recombination protein RecT
MVSHAERGEMSQLNTRDIKSVLESANVKASIADRLPRHLSADRIIKVAVTAINKNPDLLKCTRDSILMAVMQSAELGLEPGGALGEAYLIPYGTTCQFIPGYRGLISLARRSGQIVSIEAHVVREKDEFEYELGLEQRLKHRPYIDGEPGKLRIVYAVAKLKDGGTQLEVMTRAQVDAIRNASKGKNSIPWKDHYEEMARKTVVRRIFKYLPVSVELAAALEIQAKAEAGDFFDGEAIRPGDAPINDRAERQQDGDGNTIWAWTDEQVSQFEAYREAIAEAGMDAELYTSQKDSGEDHPDTVLNRMHTAIENMGRK